MSPSQIRKIIEKIPYGDLILKKIRPLGHGIKALVYAQKYDFPAKKLKIIGITGTKGKTTTTTYLGRLLNLNGVKAGYISTAIISTDGQSEVINPYKMSSIDSAKMQQKLSEMIKNGCSYAVLEMSSQGLEQNRHWGLYGFDMAIFLNMYPEHIEAHGSFENYLNCKSILFENLRKGGKLLFNMQSEFWPQMSYSIKKFIARQSKLEKISINENLYKLLQSSQGLNPFYHPKLDPNFDQDNLSQQSKNKVSDHPHSQSENQDASNSNKNSTNIKRNFDALFPKSRRSLDINFDVQDYESKINRMDRFLDTQIFGISPVFRLHSRGIFKDFQFSKYEFLEKVLSEVVSINLSNHTSNKNKANPEELQVSNFSEDTLLEQDFGEEIFGEINSLNLVAEFEIENLYFAYTAASLILKSQVNFNTDEIKLNTAVPGRMEWVVVDSQMV